VPNARVVEGPEESPDVDDDDKADDDPAEELELSMDTARPDVVFGTKVVPYKHGVLDNVDAANR
jgi:hypothetical protein